MNRGARIASGIVIAILVIGVAWGGLEPRIWLDEREIEARLPGLSTAWEGEELAIIADLQVGMWGSNDGMLKRVVRRIVERRPRALLVAGDFVYHPEKDLDAQVAWIEDLFRPVADASVPIYAVLGNHDWGISDRSRKDPQPDVARRLRADLERMGIHVLEGRHTWLELEGERLALVGLGSHWADRDGVDLAFADLPDDAPRVVFMHHPDSYERIPAGRAPFAVAAHTHGGQVRFPFLPGRTWVTFVVDDEVHADGWIEDEYGAPGNRLYVNRGLGFSRVPLRINSRPELTWVRLTRASPKEGAVAR